MNKKAIYSILSTIVAMMVLSVSLVFAIGPYVSADEAELIIGVLDKVEYFDYADDECTIIVGLSVEGYEYACQFDELHAVIPNGVTEIHGVLHYRTRVGFTYFSMFSHDRGSPIYPLMIEPSNVTSIILPNSLKKIGNFAFNGCGITSIRIPANVTTIDYSNDYHSDDEKIKVFENCPSLTEIIVEDEALLTSEDFAPYADIMRYEAPKCTVGFDSLGGNTIENQSIIINETAMEPNTPTKDGYEFKGWLLNGEPYDFATPVTADMTLTAKWEAVQAQPEPETPAEENSTEVNNQNNAGLIAGIAGTSAGILIIAGIVVGIVITKRRRK